MKSFAPALLGLAAVVGFVGAGVVHVATAPAGPTPAPPPVHVASR